MIIQVTSRDKGIMDRAVKAHSPHRISTVLGNALAQVQCGEFLGSASHAEPGKALVLHKYEGCEDLAQALERLCQERAARAR